LLQDFGREPTSDEIATSCNSPSTRPRRAQDGRSSDFLAVPGSDSDETSFGDFIEDKSSESPSEVTSFSLLKTKLTNVLCSLSSANASLELRFGIATATLAAGRSRQTIPRHPRTHSPDRSQSPSQDASHPTPPPLHGFLEIEQVIE